MFYGVFVRCHSTSRIVLRSQNDVLADRQIAGPEVFQADVDLRKESQGQEKDHTSIQARMIRELRGRNYIVISDDDSKGEAADILQCGLWATLPNRQA